MDKTETKYLLLFEGGDIEQSDELPSECDESIEAGVLDVFRFHGNAFEFRIDGDWEVVDDT